MLLIRRVISLENENRFYVNGSCFYRTKAARRAAAATSPSRVFSV